MKEKKRDSITTKLCMLSTAHSPHCVFRQRGNGQGVLKIS